MSCDTNDDPTTTTADHILPEVLLPTEMTLEQLCAELQSSVPTNSPKSEELRATYRSIAETLVENEGGGAIIAVAPNSHTQKNTHIPLKAKLQIRPFDGFGLLRLFRKIAGDGSVGKGGFMKILSAFSAQKPNEPGGPGQWKDKWNENELQSLVDSLGIGHETTIRTFIEELAGQPKDGALVSSYKGTIVAAAVELLHKSHRWQLNNHGSRHGAALGTAEWLLEQRCFGAVLVRSDDGGVTAFLPDHAAKTLKAMYVPTKPKAATHAAQSWCSSCPSTALAGSPETAWESGAHGARKRSAAEALEESFKLHL